MSTIDDPWLWSEEQLDTHYAALLSARGMRRAKPGERGAKHVALPAPLRGMPLVNVLAVHLHPMTSRAPHPRNTMSNRSFTRPLQLHDLDAAGIPTRNVEHYRDGGSWSAEVYIGDMWVRARHTHGAETTIDGMPSVVEVTVKIG